MEASHLNLLLLVQAERDIFKEAEARVTAGQQPGAGVVVEVT